MQSDLNKSHVKEHMRLNEKTGKMELVHAYDDKRQKKEEEAPAKKNTGINLINAGVWGNRWKGKGADISVYEYQTKPYIELSMFDVAKVQGVSTASILKELTDYADKGGKRIEIVGMPMATAKKYAPVFQAAGFKPPDEASAKKGVVMAYGAPKQASNPQGAKGDKSPGMYATGKMYKPFGGEWKGEGSHGQPAFKPEPKPPYPKLEPGKYADWDYQGKQWVVKEKKKAFGGIVLNDKGEILLRKPTNGFGGYSWTFPKGRQDEGDTPEQTALREVEEETGVRAKVLGELPGKFEGDVTSTGFFIMQLESDGHEMDDETEAVEWVHPDRAHEYIGETPNEKGRARDLSILEAAIKEIKEKGYSKPKKKPKWMSATMQRFFGKSLLNQGDRSFPIHYVNV